MLPRLCLLFLVIPPVRAGAQEVARTSVTAEQVLDQYVAARGGRAAMDRIRTLVFTGATRPDGSVRRMWRARPHLFSIGGEGFDGAAWEVDEVTGLRAYVTHAPGAALRHTAYFDDPLVMAREPGWQVQLTGRERIAGREAHRLRITFPDGWVNEIFVDTATHLMAARRWTAPFHAFGEEVTTETHFGQWERVAGVLYPMRVAEYDLTTGELLGEGVWQRIEANVPIPYETFRMPPAPDTPISRLVNGIFGSRFLPDEAVAWYRDARRAGGATGATGVTEAMERAVASVAYDCLKSGAVPTGLQLLQALVQDRPSSARVRFGLGRALRAAGREAEAVVEFREALRLDPSYAPAATALRTRRVPY